MQGLLSFVKQNNFLCTKLIIFECDDSKSELVADEGEKSDMTGSLDSLGQLSLMLCASACDSAGQNFSSLGSKFSESCNILIIDVFYLFSTENANFFLLSVHANRLLLHFLFHYTKPPILFLLP